MNLILSVEQKAFLFWLMSQHAAGFKKPYSRKRVMAIAKRFVVDGAKVQLTWPQRLSVLGVAKNTLEDLKKANKVFFGIWNKEAERALTTACEKMGRGQRESAYHAYARELAIQTAHKSRMRKRRLLQRERSMRASSDQ